METCVNLTDIEQKETTSTSKVEQQMGYKSCLFSMLIEIWVEGKCVVRKIMHMQRR